MKDIEDRLQEEYDKVEVPDYMFDTSRVFKRVEKEKNNTKKNIISIAASVAVIILIAVAFIAIIMSNTEQDNIEINEKSKEKNSNIEFKAEIVLQNKKAKDLDFNDDYIVSVINYQILDNQIINNIPYTRIKAKVLNSYFGKLSGEIEIYVPGGIFSIKDIKDNVKYDQIDDISAFNDEDKIKVTYYNEIYIPVAEEGKTYITTLNEIDGKYFVNMNSKYGFKEYDPETNIVKDDMGDEQLDIDRYLESINI